MESLQNCSFVYDAFKPSIAFETVFEQVYKNFFSMIFRQFMSLLFTLQFYTLNEISNSITFYSINSLRC